MKEIIAEFTDLMPPDGVDKHREGTRRRLFSQCICKLENEGMPSRYSVEWGVIEQTENNADGQPAFVRMTVNAVFTLL